MNFYILTFKRKVLLFFLFLLTFFIVLNFALMYVADKKTTKLHFVEEKMSKIKHFELNEPYSKDMVFIGSSKTEYHINTNLFKENGINVFNLGVSGSQFEDYPTTIERVLKFKPKKIVISLSVFRLFNDMGVPSTPEFEELKTVFPIDKHLFLKSAIKYIEMKNLFIKYSKSIYHKIVANYNKFEPNRFEVRHTSKVVSKDINYSELVGCDVFSNKKMDKKLTLKCTNGDGVLIGKILSTNENKTVKKLDSFNAKSIIYIKKLLMKIKESNVDVVLILEPLMSDVYMYDSNQIKYIFEDTNVLDLTNYKVKEDMWADEAHLNYQGRDLYSNYLIKLYNDGVL